MIETTHCPEPLKCSPGFNAWDAPPDFDGALLRVLRHLEHVEGHVGVLDVPYCLEKACLHHVAAQATAHNKRIKAIN